MAEGYFDTGLLEFGARIRLSVMVISGRNIRGKFVEKQKEGWTNLAKAWFYVGRGNEAVGVFAVSATF
jgi:hypothetical protein